MSKIKFGTDGIRGLANCRPVDPQTLYQIGLAVGEVLGQGGLGFVATDSRRSGAMLQAAVSAGIAATGTSIAQGGVMPTAALSLAVQDRQASFGLMITASHNPACDNGIKIFASGGRKISDTQQIDLETRINAPEQVSLAEPGAIGRIEADAGITEPYLKLVRSLINDQPLSGLKLVVDCANGASSALAPKLLGEAGAEVIAIHDQPDGDNINANCGSTHPKTLQEQVLASGASAGIAFDGDADRVLLVDETGTLVDGDQILARLATDWQKEGALKEGRVIATVMSNMGLDRYLGTLGLELERTPVGDRHVAERLAERGANLGGEQSGHILMPDLLPSGDGLISGLMPLLSLARSGLPASVHLRPFTALPQILHNVRFTGSNPLIQPAVKAAIRQAIKTLGASGRVLVRPSGTEPLIRVMAEAQTRAQAQAAIDLIAGTITQAK
jgi:phosphoglucosamine mutase